MRAILVAALLTLAVPFALAQSGGTSCEGGLGAGVSSCEFWCEEGENVYVHVDGLAVGFARCGGGEACSPAELCVGSSRSVSGSGSGSCEVWGYLWLRYSCGSS